MPQSELLFHLFFFFVKAASLFLLLFKWRQMGWVDGRMQKLKLDTLVLCLLSEGVGCICLYETALSHDVMSYAVKGGNGGFLHHVITVIYLSLLIKLSLVFLIKKKDYYWLTPSQISSIIVQAMTSCQCTQTVVLLKFNTAPICINISLGQVKSLFINTPIWG